jgi:NADPH:quinone reductase
MIAAWYDRHGPPAEVLQVGELTAVEPGPGEVRIGEGTGRVLVSVP